MVTLFTLRRLLLIALFCKYKMWLDFKVESFISSYEEGSKENKILYNAMKK